jgi:hypothetical protein
MELAAAPPLTRLLLRIFAEDIIIRKKEKQPATANVEYI